METPRFPPECCLAEMGSHSHFVLRLGHLVRPYDFHYAENTDRTAEFDNKNAINCKTRNIVEFAKTWRQFIKIRVFSTIISVFFTAPKPNE